MEQTDYHTIDKPPETSKFTDTSNNNEAKEQEAEIPEKERIPKPSVVSTFKTKKAVKRKRKTTEQKIDEAERYRDRCMERIKIMEQKELDYDDDGVTLETIDKLRKKVIEFEEVICGYYESEFDYKDPKSSNVFSKIFITSTGLEPLNQCLTELVNDIVTKEHVCAGYRCVTFDDVDKKIRAIAESAECPIVGMVVPLDEIKREEFIISVVDSVNSHCRKLRRAEFFVEQEVNCAENEVNEVIDVTEPVPSLAENDSSVENVLDASLNAVLLNMKHEGEIELGDVEVGDCIDLCREGSDEDDEADDANQGGSLEEDKENEDTKDDVTSEADIQELLSQPMPNIGEDDVRKTHTLIEDGSAAQNETNERSASNNIASSECIAHEGNLVEEVQAPVRHNIETIEIDDSESENANDDDDDSIQILFQHTNSCF